MRTTVMIVSAIVMMATSQQAFAFGHNGGLGGDGGSNSFGVGSSGGAGKFGGNAGASGYGIEPDPHGYPGPGSRYHNPLPGGGRCWVCRR